MIKKPNEYGRIRITNLYDVQYPPVTQRMTRRQNAYPYVTFKGNDTITDFDVLRFSFDESFFRLPSYSKKIESHEHGRPDTLSNTVYGDTDFWSFIMLYNRLVNSEELYAERVVRIPVRQQLEQWLLRNLVQNPSSNTTSVLR